MNFKRLLVTAILLVCSAAEIHALPPSRPGIADPLTRRFRTTGQPLLVIPKEVRTYRRVSPLDGKYPVSRLRVTSKRAASRPLAIDTSTDSAIRPLVLLIDFNDRPAPANVADKAVFDALFFGAGPADLSVRNYWSEVSYGAFAVNGSSADINPATSTPTGWLRAGVDFPTAIAASDNVAGVQVANVRQLIADAVAFLAGQGANFSPYVRPSDGTFHAVILVHPGYGAEDSGDVLLDPYSHTAGIPPIVTAQGSIVDYVIVPSVQFYSDPTPRGTTVDDPLIGIGVIAHEMGHLFGLPDLYPTASLEGQVSDIFSGVGVFDLMGYGLWGNNLLARADVPAHLSAWSKARLGWLTPSQVTATSTRTLRPVEIFPEADKVLSNTTADPEQYFLVENRQVSSSLGTWLFDTFLPGSGVLIWQIDESVIDNNIATNTVNVDPDLPGISVKEADGILDLAASITGSVPADFAKFFGLAGDYFAAPGQVFNRTSPSAAVNSSPVIDNVFHPFDFGAQVEMLLFERTGTNAFDYVVNLSVGGGGGPAWKTFNVNSTTQEFPATPMRSNDILSIAFDSGNNVWMGSRDRGIFRFLGTGFEFLTTIQGLPSGSGTPVAPVQVMTFEPATGSMWVGTDRGLFKMRDSGSGFRVQASFTDSQPNPLPVSRVVQAVAVRNGTDIKYVGTQAGLIRIVDALTDAEADDSVGTILSGDVTAVAIDNNGNTDVQDDIVWAGFSDGRLFRSLLASEGGPADGDPVLPSHFKSYTLTGSPRMTSLAVDKQGILWIGTETLGAQAFDLGETLAPPLPNLRDPFDFDIDGDREVQAYLNTTRGLASNHVTGIAFQATGDAEAIAWMSHVRDLNNVDGGVSRFDANSANDNATVLDERVAVFRPEAGVPPEDQVNGPASIWVSTAAADSAGNVWFGTTVLNAQGASRFGNAGVISLDSSNYVNTTAIATVTLQDDGLNSDPAIADLAIVRVTSAGDGVGFFMVLTETGPDTGVFRSRFGFTNGASDGGATPPLIRVDNGNTVTVTYVDFNPPGVRTATATWKKIFPFEDSLLIEGGACFIATAAYGSFLAPEVRTLRRFRDRFLLGSVCGKGLVGLYYRLSPPLAGLIAESPALQEAARIALVPLILLADLAMGTSGTEWIAILSLLFCLSALCLAPARRKRGSSR